MKFIGVQPVNAKVKKFSGIPDELWYERRGEIVHRRTELQGGETWREGEEEFGDVGIHRELAMS